MHWLVILCVLTTGTVRASSAINSDLGVAIDAIRRQHGISATVYFVVSPDTTLQLRSLGTPSWDTRESFEVDHLVRIGSITKTFTALAAMVLVERGELSLHANVRETLPTPPLVNRWANEHPVRIAHLMEHTAGLHDMSAKEFAFNEPLPLDAAFRVDPESRDVAWPPGLHSSYSNSGAGILSRVIEQVTGESYETFVANEIFVPLGMSSARFTVDESDRDTLIAGYDTDGHTPIDYWHTLYRAFGGISVAPRDMIPFVQLFLNRGKHGAARLLSETAIERMQRPETTLAARSGLGYGYGLGVYQFQHRGLPFYGHGGDADGYLSFFAYSPALARGYFIAINAFNKAALREMRRVVENELVASNTRAQPAIAPLSDTQIETLSGNYREVTARFAARQDLKTMSVHLAGDTLYSADATGRRRALIAVSEWHFRRPDQSVATIAFIPCGDRIFLQGDFGNYEKPMPGAQLAPCPINPR